MIRGISFIVGCLAVILPVGKLLGLINITWVAALAPIWASAAVSTIALVLILLGGLIVWIKTKS